MICSASGRSVFGFAAMDRWARHLDGPADLGVGRHPRWPTNAASSTLDDDTTPLRALGMIRGPYSEGRAQLPAIIAWP